MTPSRAGLARILPLLLAASPALAQEDAAVVGLSVEGTIVEVSAEVAAEACGVDAETILAEWATLGTEVTTMADTSVAADATDLAPAVEADTAMDSAIDGESPTDGADATLAEDGSAATDVASDGAAEGGSDSEAGAAGNPTEGTTLAQAAVCDVSRETADALGIEVPG